MENKKEYVHIKLEHLGDKMIFPFHIYVYNPVSGKYSPFLYANSPLIQEKFNFLEMVENKGGDICVKTTQKETLKGALDLTDQELEGLIPKEEEVHELEDRQEQLMKELAQREEQKGKFHFKDALKKAAEEDNFTEIIEQTRLEVMSFSPRVSHTVSLASFLAENYLVGDNIPNRIVAFAYQMAKSCKFDDVAALGDLVTAAFFVHLGHTQLDKYYSQTPQMDFYSEAKKEYKKHPGLTHHLLKKSEIDLSDRCIKIILEHHERADGGGYPGNKMQSHIDPMALVLGASTHLIEYTSGRITGQKQPFKSVILNIKNKTFIPGLEVEFGDTIYENISYLMDTSSSSEEEKQAA